MIRQTITGTDYIHDLISITYEVTYACNFKCEYCYNPIPRYNGAKTDQKDAVWKKLMEVEGPLQIIMLGGETTYYKKAVNYWNEYVTTFKDDETKSINLYTHGNNTPEVYSEFLGGKDNAYLGFSYHPGQTNEELYFKNIELVRNNDVNVVVCLVTTTDKKDWPKAKEILSKAKALGCQTQIEFCVTTENRRNATADAYEYFEEFLYRCYKINKLHFKSSKEDLTLCRDDYNLMFVNGLNDTKKLCTNRTFKISPELYMRYECDVNGEQVELAENIDAFDEFIKKKTVTCEQFCTGIAATLNEKVFLADTIKDIRA